MKTLAIAYTRGDHCTQPGGVILRQHDSGQYVAHHFNRAYGSTTPTEFFWGRYHEHLDDARKSYQDKLSRAEPFLIDDIEILTKEVKP